MKQSNVTVYCCDNPEKWAHTSDPTTATAIVPQGSGLPGGWLEVHTAGESSTYCSLACATTHLLAVEKAQREAKEVAA